MRASDAVARALSGMTAEGWAKLSGPLIQQGFEAQLEAQRAEIQKRVAVFGQCFETDAGREVIDTLFREVFLANLIRLTDERLTLEQQALNAARREGQNSVIAMILNALAIARGEPPTMKEGT